MQPGDHLGKYRLKRQIGDGAMGVVWAAVNEDTHKEVALKLLSAPDEELRRRMLREAKACGRLDHRNIVSIYDTGRTEDGEPFLVMALLAGETLSARLRRVRALPPAEAVAIAGACASGLGAAHAAGIVHRDLKPDNVFLHREAGSQGEVVKLLDFGVSHLQLGDDSGATATGAILGSPAYMSPEQARGSKALDPRSDIWSLGVVLFEMLTGERPFPGKTVADALAQVLVGPIPTVASRVPGVAPGLSDLVAACLSRDPSQRPATAEEVAARLSSLVLYRADADPNDDSADDETKVRDPRIGRAVIAPPPPSGAAAAPPAPLPYPNATLPLPLGPTADDDTADGRATEPLDASRSPAKAPAGPPGAPPVLGALPAVSSTTPLTRAHPASPPSRTSLAIAVAGLVSVALLVLVVATRKRGEPEGPSDAPPVVASNRGSASTQEEPLAASAPQPEPSGTPETAASETAAPESAASAHTPGGAPHAGPTTAWLTVRANATARVFVDDQAMGVTPLAPLSVKPGPHKIVFKHTVFGQRTVMVTAKPGVPLTVSVDFNAKGAAVGASPSSPTHPGF